jgi:hypothetical protein
MTTDDLMTCQLISLSVLPLKGGSTDELLRTDGARF